MNSTNNLAPTTALNYDQRDADDMARLAKGHDASLNELMERHAEKLFHYLLRSLQDESDAEDIAQETFVKDYQNRAKFDARHKFSTWLYAIASNLISRARKRLRAALADGRQWRRINGVSCNPEKLGPSRRIPTPSPQRLTRFPASLEMLR